MTISDQTRAAFLKQRPIFKDLSDEDITAIAGRMEEFTREANMQIFEQGGRGNVFHIIYTGKVRVWLPQDKKEIEIATLEVGDMFGEEALLLNRPRSASVSTLEKTEMLILHKKDFLWMLNTYPSVRTYIVKLVESRQKARRQQFQWMQSGEVVHLISRRHIAQFLINLIKPLAGLLVGVFFLTVTQLIPGFGLLSQIFGYAFLIFGLLWAIWEYIDWRNDYFIITNQRVIWMEQVLLQTASRREAPMAAIQSVDVKTSQMGRILGYGNVFVRTYTGTGSLNLNTVDRPKLFKSEIEDLLLRVREKSEVTADARLRYSIRQSLGMEAPEVSDPVLHVVKPQEEPKRGLVLLRTRQVEGDTITYHKHWWVLLSRIWWQTLLMIALITVAVYASAVQFQILGVKLPVSSFFFLWGTIFLVLLGIIGYHYLDWKNDIYQLTKDLVIDSEKKPLGQEITRSAPIKNIQSLEHQRKGLLRLILNFGVVKVVVADATLTFLDVHNPAQVQQDIYYRQEEIKLKAEESQQQEERNNMSKWLRAYHDIWQEEQAAREQSLEEDEEYDG